MALLVRELVQLIAHKTDSPDAGAMSGIAIVNEAGRFIVSLRPWNFQLRPSATLALVSGQNYLLLPADFGRIAGPPTTHPSGQRIRQMQMSTFDIVTRMRGSLNPTSGIDGTYIGAVVFAPAAGGFGGPPVPRIEVWPPVAQSDATAFALPYYACWDERSDDAQFVNVPPYAEDLLRHLVREIAAGYENDDEKSVWAREDEILASSLYKKVALADGGHQTNLGPLQGGAADLVAGARSSGVRGDQTFYPVHI